MGIHADALTPPAMTPEMVAPEDEGAGTGDGDVDGVGVGAAIDADSWPPHAAAESVAAAMRANERFVRGRYIRLLEIEESRNVHCDCSIAKRNAGAIQSPSVAEATPVPRLKRHQPLGKAELDGSSREIGCRDLQGCARDRNPRPPG